MIVIDRADVALGGGGAFTYKKMGNGEERRRIVFLAGTRVSETVAADWMKGDGFPWQDAHYHKGLTEHYFVQAGWVMFLFENNNRPEGKRVEAGGHIFFLPEIPHTVLMGPKSVMATLLIGSPIGNPDRKDDDWWPVVASRWATIIEEIEKDLSF